MVQDSIVHNGELIERIGTPNMKKGLYLIPFTMTWYNKLYERDKSIGLQPIIRSMECVCRKPCRKLAVKASENEKEAL